MVCFEHLISRKNRFDFFNLINQMDSKIIFGELLINEYSNDSSLTESEKTIFAEVELLKKKQKDMLAEHSKQEEPKK